MFGINFEFISGMMLGVEFVSEKEVFEGGTNDLYIVLDLLIVRVLITYMRE